MSRSNSAERLRDALRSALVDRLAPTGWRVADPDRHDAFSLIDLVRPLEDGFEATAQVCLDARDRPPLRVTDVMIGVSYEPLRRWWPLLGHRFAHALIGESLRWSGVDPSAADDDEAFAAAQSEPLVTVATEEDARTAAGLLASEIQERAVSYAESLSGVDQIRCALEDAEDPDWVDIRLPALLTAMGDFDQASQALDRVERSTGDDAQADRRVPYQLRRLIAAGGDPALIPKAPPPSRFAQREPRPSVQAIWSATRSRHEAVEEVRRDSEGRDRDELRTMLEAALKRRGLHPGPTDVESTLDHMFDTATDHVRTGVEFVRQMGRLGALARKAFRDHELPDMSPPDWLQPPEPAFYNLPEGSRSIAVSLAPGVEESLGEVHQASRSRYLDTAVVPAWLKPADERTASGPISVYIGERRVGSVPDEAVAAYRPVIEAAAFRDEYVCLSARLADRDQPPHFILELRLPPS